MALTGLILGREQIPLISGIHLKTFAGFHCAFFAESPEICSSEKFTHFQKIL
jgi:hypothetical protein